MTVHIGIGLIPKSEIPLCFLISSAILSTMEKALPMYFAERAVIILNNHRTGPSWWAINFRFLLWRVDTIQSFLCSLSRHTHTNRFSRFIRLNAFYLLPIGSHNSKFFVRNWVLILMRQMEVRAGGRLVGMPCREVKEMMRGTRAVIWKVLRSKIYQEKLTSRRWWMKVNSMMFPPLNWHVFGI